MKSEFILRSALFKGRNMSTIKVKLDELRTQYNLHREKKQST
jgi:hypothetical protein